MATITGVVPRMSIRSLTYNMSIFSSDAEIPTRVQHDYTDTPLPNNPTNTVRVGGTVTFNSGDFAAIPAGYVCGIGVRLIPEGEYTDGALATPNTKYYRATSPLTGPGSTTNTVSIPKADLVPNTKYWAVFLPTAWNPASFPSFLDLPRGAVDVTGYRAMSFWTNRPPAAPVISSPINGATYTVGGPGTTLAWNINDPDNLGTDTPEEWDQRGWEASVRPVPSLGDPNPAWSSLEFQTLEGLRAAVTMKDTTWGGPNLLWEDRSIPIVFAASDLSLGDALLTAGQWQLRVRTFDFGTTAYQDDPDSFYHAIPAWSSRYSIPESNTSPWSNSVTITVKAPNPPPLLVWPSNDSAVVNDPALTFTYVYRDSRTPPGFQIDHSLRMRKVGTPDWTDVFTTVSSGDHFFVVTPADFLLESGFRYEWQAKITSTDPEFPEYYDSGWSLSSFFWVAPAPGSGSEIPVPGDTIDLTELGCGTHTAYIYDRGGTRRIAQVTQMARVKWDRRRDDISEAEIKVVGWSEDCGKLLSTIRSWIHELVIFRDSGQGPQRVWEGPITHITYETNSVTLSARDPMVYVYRRILKVGFSDAYRKVGDQVYGLTPVTTRAKMVIQDALAPADPNVLAYLQVFEYDDDARQTRSVKPWSTTAFEVVDDMAAKSGLDYTTVGRRIILWDTHRQIGQLPEMHDGDFDTSPIVTEYGMLLATVYGVTNGDGLYGSASKGYDPTVDAEPDYYSFVEMLVSTWTDGAEGDSGTLSFESQQKMIEALTEQAERGIRSRWPAPVVVRIPDNSRLNPEIGIGINQLIPGVAIPLRSNTTLREVTQRQKLDRVDVVEENGVEQVRVTMSPFPTGDTDSDDDGGMGEE